MPAAPTTSGSARTREAVEAIYAAFARGDVPTVLTALDPQIVWIETEGGPFGGRYSGPQAVLENVFGPLGAEWDDFALIPETVVCDGDHAAVLGTYTGRCRATGRDLTARFSHTWALHDGRPERFEQITDTALWNAAVRGGERNR